MKKNYSWFSRFFVLLVMLVLTNINIYPQRGFAKVLESASKAAKQAAKAGERSYKISEKFTAGSDGVLHRVPRTSSYQSRSYVPKGTPVRRPSRSTMRRNSTGRVYPYAAANRAISRTCPKCHGTGRNRYGNRCSYCGGSGRVSMAKAMSY